VHRQTAVTQTEWVRWDCSDRDLVSMLTNCSDTDRVSASTDWWCADVASFCAQLSHRLRIRPVQSALISNSRSFVSSSRTRCSCRLHSSLIIHNDTTSFHSVCYHLLSHAHTTLLPDTLSPIISYQTHIDTAIHTNRQSALWGTSMRHSWCCGENFISPQCNVSIRLTHYSERGKLW